MALLAVLYDIHGNRAALEAVVDDARADGFILGGDYALFGPFPAETVAMLEELPHARWIRGNVDRFCAHPEQVPDDARIRAAVGACREVLDAGALAMFDALPEQVVIDGTRYCHASPISDMRSFMLEPGDDDDELLGGVSEPRVVFGHTHLQFRRSGPGGVELLNPGSVGLPFDGDHRAAYALLHDDGSIEHRRVAYDHEATARALVERFGDVEWVEMTADRLRRARM